MIPKVTRIQNWWRNRKKNLCWNILLVRRAQAAIVIQKNVRRMLVNLDGRKTMKMERHFEFFQKMLLKL